MLEGVSYTQTDLIGTGRTSRTVVADTHAVSGTDVISETTIQAIFCHTIRRATESFAVAITNIDRNRTIGIGRAHV